MSPSSFSSLPIDIVWNIFARVPKRSYPMISCVSKNFRDLVRSQEIQKIRSCLGKDSLYICLNGKTNGRKWFTLRRAENDKEGENQFVSVDLVFSCQYEGLPCIIATGHEIFFICGSLSPASCLWIFDSRTGKFRRGPSSKVDRLTQIVGLVGSKIYVIGRYPDDEIHAESFDIKTQTWEMAPDPERLMHSSYEAVSLDKKICTLSLSNYFVKSRFLADCYDTRDGSCEIFEMPKDKWWRTGACVIDNVLYIYYARFGLMWYDSNLRLWRLVNGLNHLNKVGSVGMAEYYGKLAFLWTELGGETMEIWCRMIALERSEVGVHGSPEASQFLGTVPLGYKLEYCLSLSD